MSWLVRTCTRDVGRLSTEETVEIFASNVVGDHPLGSFRRHALAVRHAFRQPGALERVCHHSYRDFLAAELIGIRMADDLIHTWDLTHAVGGDEHLDEELS